MRKDHRPYVIKKAWLKFQKFYTRHFLAPQLERLGNGHAFMQPWHVELFGGPIEIGRYATVIATSDKKVRLSVWPEAPGNLCFDWEIGDEAATDAAFDRAAKVARIEVVMKEMPGVGIGPSR